MTGAQDLLERPALEDSSSCKSPEEVAAPSIWTRIAHYSPYMCEFVGTMLLSLVWNCNSFDTSGGPWKPLCMGLMLLVMTYCFASISGAEFNPAVTLAVGFAGKGDWRTLFRNVVAQLAGCGFGVGLSILIFGQSIQDRLGPRPPYTGGTPVFAVETVYTCMLCFVYLNCLYSRAANPVKSGNQFFGIAMGFAMMAAGYAAQDVSGAVLNPAIALVIYFENYPREFWTFLLYIASHGLGAFIAAVIFRIVRPDENDCYMHWLAYSAQENRMGITKRKAFSEGMGTGLFVFTMGMTELSRTFPTARPLAGGAVYVSMNYCLSDCSGGYFNPAVTLSVMMSCRKRCSLIQGVCYIVVQIISATIAALACAHATNGSLVPTVASNRYSTPQVCGVELILMNITCFAVLASSTVKGINTHLPHNFYHGLVYGLAYAAGGFATYGLTKGVLNPAVSMGVGIANHIHNYHQADSGLFFRKCLCMAIFEFGGAIFAVCIFRWTHARQYRKDSLETSYDDLEVEGEAQPLTMSDSIVKGLPSYGDGAPQECVGA